MTTSTSETVSSSPGVAGRYTSGEHLAYHPNWHVEESRWKADQVLNLLVQHDLAPRTVGDVGCGAGEVLRLLQTALGPDCECWGYDISPQALALSQPRANPRLHFRQVDLTRDKGDVDFDLLLALDVIEHVEDCFGFLRALRPRAHYKIFELPLDLSAQAVLRPSHLLAQREQHGHVHFFTKELALRLLVDAGYSVIDYHYGAVALELWHQTLRNFLLREPRRLLATVDVDFAARLLGGYRLLVLAQ